MKIYLIDNDKVQKYILPNKVEESYLINYNSGSSKIDNTITIEANGNEWQIRSNGNVNIISNNNTLDSTLLKPYNHYLLKLLGQDKYIILYAVPIADNTNYNLDIRSIDSITIGNDKNCNIIYQSSYIVPLQAKITKKDNFWTIEEGQNLKIGIYINGKKCSKKKLQLGDVIFIDGLKIILVDHYIKINNPGNLVSVLGLNSYKEIKKVESINPVSDEENSKDLYKEDDYFYHVPFIKEKLANETLEIDAPPASQLQEELPLALSLASSLTMLASSVIIIYNIVEGLSQGKPLSNYVTQMIMCVAMVVGSVIVPKIIQSYQRNRRKQKEELRQTKYKAYLDKKNNEINDILNKQSRTLFDNYPNIIECGEAILNKTRNLWYRDLTDNDFLKIRLGIGNISAFLEVSAPKESFRLDEDNLVDAVNEIVKSSKQLKNVPITISLTEKNKLSFICNCSYKYQYINGIITQLISLHSPSELKIILFTNKYNEEQWEFIKLLPHIWNRSNTIRFFSTSEDDSKEIINFLDEEYKHRKEILKAKDNDDDVNIEGFKKYPPYYVIITDDYKSIKDNSLIDNLLNCKENYGFSFIGISDTMKNLPSRCETFIDIGEKVGTILEKEIDSQSQQKFTNEYIENLDMNKLSVQLSNIPYTTADEQMALPTVLPFMEMFGVSKIEQFNILNRWQKNSPVTTLSTPVGVHTNGDLFKLDLHEKFHGPHGLIAGSTGSGKSEFIITYILSMAINYHPYEVQFVLIDYKGGGLAGAFENKETGVRIPHLAGTITNLDTSSMNRTLVSIESELKRRQRVFNEVRDSIGESTIDIYKYQRLYREGVVKEPMSHLFIISDEFAELKSQQPDFMQQLISTSRIGRALGVHLILATQKPSGVVNDQIWSNSKFKVCLKVQDKSDSNEMLKKPDAASLKDVGRFYLQVGYDEYFDIGQSAWGGAKYIPSDKVIKKIDDSINFINNVGYSIRSVNDNIKKEEIKDIGDQLTNIVKYISTLAKKENIINKKLWLDPIPEKIYVSELVKKYNYKATSYNINPVIGEYDKPKEQEQGLLNINITQDNTLIYGEPGSGKEGLLTTILWSSITEHTPNEVNFYIIDCGAETLKMFYKMPHVGEVVTVEDGDKVLNVFEMMYDEIQMRKNLFSDYAGSYTNYCENSGKKLPLMVVIINNYEVFSESFSKIADGIQPMIRDGSKYGVVFIITATTTGSVRIRMAQNFENKITLQLPDESDYRGILGAPRNLFPAKFYGRGLIKREDDVVEFQTAMICDNKRLNNLIRTGSEQLSKAYKTKAKKVLVIPQTITPDLFNEISLDKLPIGYDIKTKEAFDYNFIKNPITMILSSAISEKMSFIYALVEEMKKVEKANVIVVDFVNLFQKNVEGISLYKENFDSVINAFKTIASNDKENMIFLIGVSQIKKRLSTEGKSAFDNFIANIDKTNNIHFMFTDTYVPYKNLQLESWYQQNVDSSNGIWLGEGIDSQVAISTMNIGLEERKTAFDNMAFAITDGKFNIIKTVTFGDDKVEK